MRQIMLPVLLVWAVVSGAVFAQPEGDALLLGPLVAVTPARQDRILLHDLGAGTIVTRTLAFGAGEHQVWGFSPDGCRVLFTLDAAGNGLPRLYTANLDGTDKREIVQYDELAPESWGVWEPDWSAQNIIAFTMIRFQPQQDGSTKRETHIAWVEGSGGEPQFYSVTGREYTPQWSPDGAWLAYVSYDERVAGADVLATAVPTTEPPPGTAPQELPMLSEADLWVVSVDGETKYRLTNFSVGSVRAPRWSPDGELVGFIYSPSPNNDTFWMIANDQGAIPTQLSDLWNLTLDHTWLPDSAAMLAAVRDFRGETANRLWRIPLVGNADQDATLYFTDENFLYADYPRFSPDGQFLAFRAAYDLIVVDMHNATWERLDTDQPGNTPPVWSPAAFEGEGQCG